jgi:hypothetical protein
MTLSKTMSASLPDLIRQSIGNTHFREMDARVEPAHDEVIP